MKLRESRYYIEIDNYQSFFVLRTERTGWFFSSDFELIMQTRHRIGKFKIGKIRGHHCLSKKVSILQIG